MQTLLFIVQGEKLFRSLYSPIKKGEIMAIRFNFSRKWDGLKKIVLLNFSGIEQATLLDNSNVCIVPEEATKSGEFRLRLVGIADDSEQQLISNESVIKVT